MKETHSAFVYTYSPKEEADVRALREIYAGAAEDKKASGLERARELDRSVHRKSTAAALFLGISSTLVMGGGMSALLVSPETLFLLGLLLGSVGMIGVILAYPIYRVILKRERKKAAPEILRLLDTER